MACTRTSAARRAPIRRRASALCLAALAFDAPSSLAAERPVRVTIQAQPRFEQARPSFADDGAIVVSAQLVADDGTPIEGATVAVATAAVDRSASVADCTASARPGQRSTAVRTDDGGRLCVRITAASPAGRVELTFAGDGVQLPASAAIGLQPAPSVPSLAFASPSLELDLDRPTVRLQLGVSTPAGDEPIPPIELELLDGERSVRLTAREWSRSGSELSFDVDTSQLGMPGPARLVARHLGPGQSARAEAIALRVATVRLGARRLDDTDDGAELEVWTETRVSQTPSGWVEATLGDDPDADPIGSAPLVQGAARLRLASGATGEVVLHYHSDDPWWLPGQPLRLSLDGGEAPAPRRWPWLALLVPIGYVCLRSLQRPAQRKTRAPALPKPRPSGIVLEAAAPLSGWVGSVCDAHDGHPISGARVQASLPSFRGSEANTHTAVTDARGWFELPALQHPLPEGARLRVWAPLHSEVERPLPPQGRVTVSLTSRRRAVLRRLVRWARALGAPWVRGGEPTPGEIAIIAARRGDPRIARWAEDVQAAAFGKTPVDEATELELRAAEPAWPATPHPRHGREE